jgi:hypothetical protein
VNRLRVAAITAFGLSMAWPWAAGNPEPFRLAPEQWAEVAFAGGALAVWAVGMAAGRVRPCRWGLYSLAWLSWLGMWTAGVQFATGGPTVRGDIAALGGILMMGLGQSLYLLWEATQVGGRDVAGR